MRHLGLGKRMVSLIISCLSFVSYFVLLNGQPIGNIKPSRGLRQGEPLSPYLFLMCAMGLQSLIHKVEVEGLIQGVSIVEMAQGYHIYFLQMIVCYFVKPRRKNVKKSLIS